MAALTAKPTRKEALAQGLKRYYGKVCAKHPELGGERKVSHQNCVGCAREHFRKWAANNPHASRERQRKYRALHPEPHRERNRVYKRINPHRCAAWGSKRHAAKLHRIPCWLTSDDFKTIEIFYEAAAHFTKVTGVKYVVDHYYPLQGKTISGLHVPQNLWVISAAQNARKSNQQPEI